MSKADFAFEFAKQLKMPSGCMIRECSSANSGLRAIRPRDMRMDCGRFEALMKTRLPDLLEEIGLTGEEYRE